MTHNYTFYYTSKEYHEGYERIFGNAKPKDDQTGAVKKPRRNAKSNPHQKAKRSQSGKRRTARRDDQSAQESGRDHAEGSQVQSGSSSNRQ